MDKIVTGYCPAINDECSIRVTYCNVSVLEGQGFEKGRFQCKHSIYADCHISNCPIYKSAPETL